jgi:hypothetical protein
MIIALLAAPLGGAIVAIGITRVLILVVPAALLAAIGLEAVLGLVTRRVRYEAVAIGAFVVLAAANVWLLQSALNDGPRWYRDYGLYGMQFGGRQIAAAAHETWEEDDATRVLISSSWTNGGEAVFHFLLDQDPRFEIAGVDPFRSGERPLPENAVFVLTPAEYERVRIDSSFENPVVTRTIKAPDGTDAFHFVRLSISENAALIAELEKQDRLRTVTSRVPLNGEQVEITRPQFDIGRIEELFDGDTFTLGRTLAGNPVSFDLKFPSPHDFRGLHMTFGAHGIDLSVALYTPDGRRAATYNAVFENPQKTLEAELPFENPPTGVDRAVVTVRDTATGAGDYHLHVYEMRLQE